MRRLVFVLVLSLTGCVGQWGPDHPALYVPPAPPVVVAPPPVVVAPPVVVVPVVPYRPYYVPYRPYYYYRRY